MSIAGLLERSSEDLPAAEEEVTELRLRLPINLLDALHIHAQGGGLVHTQWVSSQAKHTQALRSSLRVAALGFQTNMFPRSKRHPQRSGGGHKAYVTSFSIFSSPHPVASEALDMTSHLAGLSPIRIRARLDRMAMAEIVRQSRSYHLPTKD